MFDLEQKVWEQAYATDFEWRAETVKVEARPLVQPSFQLPRSLWAMMISCYAIFFAGMVGLSGGGGAGLFMIVISVIYTAVYFVTGGVLARLPGLAADSPLDRGQALPTWCGPMDRSAVFGQVLVVPAAVAFFGLAVMTIRWLV